MYSNIDVDDSIDMLDRTYNRSRLNINSKTTINSNNNKAESYLGKATGINKGSHHEQEMNNARDKVINAYRLIKAKRYEA